MARLLITLVLLPLLASTLLTLASLLFGPNITSAELAPMLGAALHLALYIFVALLVVSVPMISLGRIASKAKLSHAIFSGLALGTLLAIQFRDTEAVSFTDYLLPALATVGMSMALSLAFWAIGLRKNNWFGCSAPGAAVTRVLP